MAQVCADRDVAFVDVTAALSADPEWLAEAAAGDRHHPSTRGYARLAALVAPAFDRWLAELAGTPGPAPCLLPDGLSARHPSAADHARMAVAMEHWWGGFGGAAGARQRAAVLPRLFVDHFADTSFVVEDAGGELVAFLVGFLSASQPRTAYVHVVAVDPARQRAGLGQQLYRCFGAVAGERGATTVRCVTSPGNAASLAFHTALGFAVEPGEAGADGVPVQRDHDGPGLDRISFVRRLPV
jgi:ribosomal protein S18 acetylase RimI-like enzyme